MASPRWVRSLTAASISPALSPGGRTSRVMRGFSSAPAGKSHSCVTPTTSSSSPSANSISVAEGTRETIRICSGEVDDGADPVLALHELEAVVDVVERELVGDERLEVELAGEPAVDQGGDVLAALEAAEGGAGHAPAGDQ